MLKNCLCRYNELVTKNGWCILTRKESVGSDLAGETYFSTIESHP